MQTAQIHEDTLLTILWDEKSRIIDIDWKEATSSMTDEDFNRELSMFAAHVERNRDRGILADVCHFHHKVGPGLEEWRVKNISSR